MSSNSSMVALDEALVEGGLADPLAEPLTLAALWADLTCLAGEPAPTDVAAPLDGPRPNRPVLAAPNPPRPCAGCVEGDQEMATGALVAWPCRGAVRPKRAH